VRDKQAFELIKKLPSAMFLRDDITVTVVEVRGEKVRLGFEAPNSVTIDREEVRDRKTASPLAD
jgi:carbon storage regulator